MGLNTMFYLISNWSSGIFNNTKYTANGLEVTYTSINTTDVKSAIGLTHPSVAADISGQKITLTNTTGSAVTVNLQGSYDNLDFRIEYRVVVAKSASLDEKLRDENGNATGDNFIAKTAYAYGKISYNLNVTIPANSSVYLFATNGQYLSVERFYVSREAPSNASYITELLKLKKAEDPGTMFLPIVEAYDISNPSQSANVEMQIAVFNNSTDDPNNATWHSLSSAVTLISSAPYFRFKVIFPANKLVAVSKIGYAIGTNFAYSEPVNLLSTTADVEHTVYRPQFKVFIGTKDYTRYVESCTTGSIVINLRKVEEDFDSFYFKKVTVYLDGVAVDGGVVTRLSKQEYPNAITYTLGFSTYRELLGASYVDNSFAFNAARGDITSLPFNNEYEYINYIVTYSPASNGIIINTEQPKEFRSFKFWTDDFSMALQEGGMGFGSKPDKWQQFYIGSQKLGMEVIEQVANANQMTSEVTHSGNLILSELIPHDKLKLGFNNSYNQDTTSLLSKCTHRYHDYGEQHLFIPDFRLNTPTVEYDALQSGALVHLNGTSGLGQVINNPTEQFIGVFKGFDTGKPEYVEPGKEYNYTTQLTTREPKDSVTFSFIARNNETDALEQTALLGTPKIHGLENISYVSNAGNVIKPTILDAAHGVKIAAEWKSRALTYQDGDEDDVFGITELKLDIWTDDLKDEPVRQAGIGLFGGLLAAILIGGIIVVAGPAAVPILGGLFSTTAAGVTAVSWGALIGTGAVLGAVLGTVSGTSSKVDIQLPIKVKGIPAIKAHQSDFVDTPLIGLPDPKFMPAWAPKAFQEILVNKEALGTETKIIDNPYVVNLKGYKDTAKSDRETQEAYLARMNKSAYRSDLAEYVATGLTLKEWLLGRQVTLTYIGNPNWFPHQFIAIARQPDNLSGQVTAYEYFYTMSAQSTNITVGGEVSTEIKAAYIGTGFLNHTSENFDIRGMKLLGGY